MRNLLNFQQFEIESTNSFLNVSTSKELKEWKKLLRAYYYLRNAGLKVSKANRKAMFEALNELKITQKELRIMIENSEADEKKQAHSETITALNLFMTELSEIKDVINVEIERKPLFRTMVYFETIETNEDNFVTFKTKGGKKFRMRDTSNFDAHKALIKKYFDMIDERKKAEKKALKASLKNEDKEQKKSDNFTEKVNEKKRKS